MSYKLLRLLSVASEGALPVLGARSVIVPLDTYDLRISDGARNRYVATPPLGAPYTRMPGDPLPGTLYPGTTWTKYSGGSGSGVMQGTFPRFDGTYTGHEASTYNVVQTSQNKSHGHSIASGQGSHNHSITDPGHNHSFNGITYGRVAYNGTNQDYGSGLAGTNGSFSINSATTGISLGSATLPAMSASNDGGTEARPVAVGIEHYRRTA